jgi:GntR family transcriptional regulator/MocR family aminotransferase
MYLELDGAGERYRQLLRALKAAMRDGRLPPGTRLPSSRQLAADLGLSRNTVVAAYELLCAEGLAECRRGTGTFVRGARPVAAPLRVATVPAPPVSRYAARLRGLPPLRGLRHGSAVAVDLQYGEPLTNPPLLEAWRRCLSQAAPHTPPGYPPAQGLPELREQIAAHLARRRGLPCDPAHVVVVAGTQQAITLLARLLADEGDAIALEAPGYALTAHALRAHGARVHEVPVDGDGIDVARLPAGPLRFVVVTPSHQFPTGSVMSLARRHELLRQAVRRGLWIVEDDYDGEFGFETGALPALGALDGGERVIHVGSFSKSMFPALRLGYVVCPPALLADLVRAKRLADMGCSALEQAAMARFMAGGRFERHLRNAAAELRRRRRALWAGLDAHCAGHVEVRRCDAGMHAVARLPAFDDTLLEQLVLRARERGLGLHPLPRDAGIADVPRLLLGFAGVSVRQIAAATRRLGECLDEIAPAASSPAPRRRAARSTA